MAFDKQKIRVAILLAIAFISNSFYLYSALPVAEYSITKEAAEGKLVWQRYNCNACHQVYGLGGYLGPDLTNEYSVKGPAYINAFLSSGTVRMPNFNLTRQEINAVLAWLENIDATGKSDPRTFTIHRNGTIDQ